MGTPIWMIKELVSVYKFSGRDVSVHQVHPDKGEKMFGQQARVVSRTADFIAVRLLVYEGSQKEFGFDVFSKLDKERFEVLVNSCNDYAELAKKLSEIVPEGIVVAF